MQFLTTDEVAALLRVHRSTVQRMIQAGKFPGSLAVGNGPGRKTWRIPESAIQRLINDAKQNASDLVSSAADPSENNQRGMGRGWELYRKFSKS